MPPTPDVVVQPRSVIDFSLRFPIYSTISGRFDAKNLLDDKYETIQGTVVRESYQTGRVLQFGLTFRP